MDLYGKGRGEELGGIEGGETIIGVYEKESMFNKRKKLKTTRSQQLDQTSPIHCQNLPQTIFAITFSSPVTG